jgi:anthranilate/para-aminobenzoate synthase component I
MHVSFYVRRIYFSYPLNIYKQIYTSLQCCEQNKIVNRPLAGTMRRGKTKEEDEMLEVQLLSDAKQCAEHVMLVDLGRNDVGKVSLKSFPNYVDILCDA